MSIFTKFWGDVKWLGKQIGHLFAAKILPFAIKETEVINNAIKSGDAQKLVDALKDVSPAAGEIGQDVLDEGKILTPKILATELGVQQLLSTGNDPQADIDFAQSLIDAYGSADLIQRSKTWNTLATQLGILYDQGKTKNKTWIQWANTIEEGFQLIKKAIADSTATYPGTKVDPVQDPPVETGTAPQLPME